jgi:hypothetical protein
LVKFKIKKGISRVTRVKLQAAIDESIAADIGLLCEWSNNEKNYVVNELLRFALEQDADFQSYKQSRGGRSDVAREPHTSSNGSRGSKAPTGSDTTGGESISR